MKICQAMLAKGFGGAERTFVDLCRALGARGHEVMAVCHPRSAAAPLLRDLPGVTPLHVRAAGSWDLLAVRRLRALLAEHAPQIIATHLARASHIGGRAARPLGIPVVTKTHNYVDLRYYRYVDWFVTTTADQKAYLLGAGVSPERIALIPNFSLLPAAADVAAAGGDLAAVGRLVPKKGMHILLRALARLTGEGLNVGLRIAGDGPERKALEALAESLGIGDRVRFAGWQWDIAAFLDGASLFVLPSLDEPFGIAIIEAMARGVPIVATTTQGPREILNGDEAWLVPPGDEEALARAIRAALTDPAAARSRAGEALRHFRSAYAADAVLPKIVELYERAAAQRSVD